MPARVPVYLLIFNRPQTTARVFEAIRAAQPSTLFIFADGPRPDAPSDKEQCQAAREIVDRVNWLCEVHRNYQDVNLGCGRAMPAGLDWVFKHVDETIILEDDCLPHPSFFPYCEEVVERYCLDARIVHIGGNNFQGRTRRGAYSYYFSKYNHIWGWATWRRAWRLFDPAITDWPQARASGTLREVCTSDEEYTHWTGVFDRLHSGGLENTWSYAWAYCCMCRGLSVTPNVNLVSNIGFGSGTHTLTPSPLGGMPTADLRPIAHPLAVVRDVEADRFTFANVVSPGAPIFRPRITLRALLRSTWIGVKKRLKPLVSGQ